MKKIWQLIAVLVSLSAMACAQTQPKHKMASKNKKYEVEKSEKQWLRELDPASYQILRKKGTERAFSGKYDLFFEQGTYYCKGCGQRLFKSDTKYNSGCGWPAFYDAEQGAIDYYEDNSFGMKRVEATCSKCGGHLGHVFPDGPKDKTGVRFCINSASLIFKKDQDTSSNP
ncbi:MAG: peptide-methionine (R)-S-oxide reductase MsrB [Cytophagales bacterium]|nr:peptide-methionine (R)-S-oxide reductase MsrB [Cytophagales bacterium]